MNGAPEKFSLENPPFHLTARDREILATKDEDFQRTTWYQLKDIIIGLTCCSDMAVTGNG